MKSNGGGAFINVLSVASWINSGAMTAYAVSKAAAWSLTNGLRNELKPQHTQVLGLHVGLDVPKPSPQSVVQQVVAEEFDDLGKIGSLQNGWAWYVGI